MFVKRAAMIGAALLPASVLAQTTVDIPLDQASGIATEALFAGDAALAVQIAEAVLLQRPDDRAALMVVAAGAPQLGDPARGQAAGARAWALSETSLERYEAARVTALAAVNAERFTAAAFWLRLALVSAPDEAQRTQTLQDARSISRRNPLSLDFSFALAPSSNVNGGAESDVSTAPGNPTGTLSPDAVALAGWRAVIGLGATYRVQESRDSRTTVGLVLRASRVRITEETSVPDETFATNSVEARIRHERVTDAGLFGGTVTFGRFDYRDLDQSTSETSYETYDLTGLAADYRVGLGADASLQITLGRDLLRYEEAGIGEVLRLSAEANIGYRLENGDVVSFGIDVADSNGDNVNYTSTQHGIRIGYRWGEPIGPATVAVSGGLRMADYPDYVLLNPVTSGRQDETVYAAIDLGFPEATFAGFVPGLRIDAAQTDSNVSRFDRNSLGAGLTITSSF